VFDRRRLLLGSGVALRATTITVQRTSIVRAVCCKDCTNGPKVAAQVGGTDQRKPSSRFIPAAHSEFRSREHLTPTEVVALIDAAKTNRYGLRDE
jgi:hypothetical protein